MKTSSSSTQAGRPNHVVRIVVGIALFAGLMALRPGLSSMWTRAAVAGVAFGTLAYVVAGARKPRVG